MDSEFCGVEIDDWVGDELTWAVVGDIAAAVCLVELYAGVCELGFGGEDMAGGVWSAGDGDDWGVFDHQDASEHGFRGVACVEDLGVVVLLELVCGLVGEGLEGDVGEGFHGETLCGSRW